MAIIAKAGADYIPAPEGSHSAVCVDVVALGILEITYNGRTEKKHMIRLVWQIDEDMNNGRPFCVSRRFTLSLHKKAALRATLEGWRGRTFTEAELAGFDVETLIGAVLADNHTRRARRLHVCQCFHRDETAGRHDAP